MSPNYILNVALYRSMSPYIALYRPTSPYIAEYRLISPNVALHRASNSLISPNITLYIAQCCLFNGDIGTQSIDRTILVVINVVCCVGRVEIQIEI